MKKQLDFFCDMDGVILDWMTAAYKAVGRSDLTGTWPVGGNKIL